MPTEASQPQRSIERTFAAGVWQEGEWYVAQALQIDVASQGETVESALTNLREALELHFEPPHSHRISAGSQHPREGCRGIGHSRIVKSSVGCERQDSKRTANEEATASLDRQHNSSQDAGLNVEPPGGSRRRPRPARVDLETDLVSVLPRDPIDPAGFFTISAIFIVVVKKDPLVKIEGRFTAEALRILRAIPGIDVDVIAEPAGFDRGVDALVRFAGTEACVAIEFKTRANAATAWHLVNIARFRPELPLVLITAETTADARRILSEHDIAFIDGLGNVHIELPGLLFHVTGTGPADPRPGAEPPSGQSRPGRPSPTARSREGMADQRPRGTDRRLERPDSPRAGTPRS